MYLGLKHLLKEKEIYIYGAGKRGGELLDHLNELGITPKAFIDKDKDKWGIYKGIPCLRLDDILSVEKMVIVISPVDNKSIIAEIDKHKYDWLLYEDIVFARYYYPPKHYRDDFCNARPFNWYESPYPDLNRIRNHAVFSSKYDGVAIDFNENRQKELLQRFEMIPFHPWGDSEDKENRYHYKNGMFGKGSADILYYFMRTIQPRRIIEVGSGYSTAVMLDVNEYYYNNSIEITCVEPNAERLKSVLKNGDSIYIYEEELQDIELSFFDKLSENDILFIDSSHVSKPGSDVNYYLFEILPRLKKGVYVHIHDVFYPMEYPDEWIIEGRAYNEMYLLRCFLMYNKGFSVQFFGEWILNECYDELPCNMRNITGSIWIRKE